ncbi:hypothetical protein HK405_005854, partial [Cladochytrium tenue]
IRPGRADVVALLNTLARLVDSTSATRSFRGALRAAADADSAAATENATAKDGDGQHEPQKPPHSTEQDAPSAHAPASAPAPFAQSQAAQKPKAPPLPLLDMALHMSFWDPVNRYVWAAGFVIAAVGVVSTLRAAYQWSRGEMKVPTEGYGRLPPEEDAQREVPVTERAAAAAVAASVKKRKGKHY